MQNIEKNDFIMEYTGEIIDENEATIREGWNDIEQVTYLFTLNSDV
jgi:SET domain-containing protein